MFGEQGKGKEKWEREEGDVIKDCMWAEAKAENTGPRLSFFGGTKGSRGT